MDALRGDLSGVDYPLTRGFLAGRLRHVMGADDLRYIEGMIEKVAAHPDGSVLTRRGEPSGRSLILIDGYVLRTMQSGDRRYIVGVHVPGDFIDLHSFALKRLDHDVVAAGPVKVGHVGHDTLRVAMREKPTVTRALWFATLLEAAVHRKWIQILEQLDAPRRIAHILAELQTRLELIGRANPRALRTPFTQLDLADMCGVSAIHANRAVAKLREAGLGELRRGDFYTSDWRALKLYAGFEGDYLYGPGSLSLESGWI